MNKRVKQLTVGFYFRLVIIGIFIASLAVSCVVGIVLDSLFFKELNSGYKLLYWFALVCFVISSAFTIFIVRWILAPVTKLNDALAEVAKGNFDVRLEETSRLREIRKSYNTFNAMVKDLSMTETLQQSFITNVSHEFKTPINAIEGYATLMQDDEGLSADQKENVGRILLNTRRLSELVGNILLLAKIENKAIAVPKERFELSEQIRQCIVALANSWTEKEIELDIELEELSFCGNEKLLYHVWQNLIGNAIKFSPTGGTISVRLRRTREQTEFTVSDCGPGIAEDELERIFDKFYQGDTSHKTEGNGLGLSLVRHILELHGGTVKAENCEGGGACFTVCLPNSPD